MAQGKFEREEAACNNSPPERGLNIKPVLVYKCYIGLLSCCILLHISFPLSVYILVSSEWQTPNSGIEDDKCALPLMIILPTRVLCNDEYSTFQVWPAGHGTSFCTSVIWLCYLLQILCIAILFFATKPRLYIRYKDWEKFTFHIKLVEFNGVM